MRFGSIIMFVVAFLLAGIAALFVRAVILGGAKASATQTAVVAVRDLKAGEHAYA